MQLLVNCVFSGQIIMWKFPNRKGTSGAEWVRCVNWSYIRVKKDGNQIWIRNERRIALSRGVLFKPDITQNESMCPTPHLAPTEEINVLNITQVTTLIV